MKTPIGYRATALPALLALLATIPLAGQDAPAAAPPLERVAPATDPLSPEAIGERIEEIENNSNLDELTRKALADRYREALSSLEQARSFREAEKEFREAIASGPSETRRLRAQLDNLRAASDQETDLRAILGDSPSRDELEEAITQSQADLAGLRAEREEVESRIASARTRPDQVSERLASANSEIGALAASLEVDGQTEETAASPSKEADLLHRRAQLARLEAEVAMLEEEELSAEFRNATNQLARELADLRIAEAEMRLEALLTLARAQLRSQVTDAEELIAEIRQGGDVPLPGPVQARLDHLSSLIEKTLQVSIAIDETGRLHRNREAERLRIETSFEEVKQQSDLGDLEGALAPILIEQLRTLQTQRETQQNLSRIRTEVTAARSGQFELERALRSTDTTPFREDSAAVPSEWKDTVNKLDAAVDTLRRELDSGYGRWIRALRQLDMTERRILAKSNEFRDFALERLFWVRSAAAIGADTFLLLPDGLQYCYGTSRFGDLAKRLADIPTSLLLILSILVAVLLLIRGQLHHWRHDAGMRIRRISTDRYSHTVTALAASLLLAAPIPLVVGVLGWSLRGQADASDWSFGMGESLIGMAWFLFQLIFLIGLCQKNGLAETHFGWSNEILRPVRRFAWWLLPTYLPAATTITLVFNESSVSYLNGLGRIAGLALVVGTGIVMAALLHPERGVAAAVHRRSPTSYFGRLRTVWFGLVIVGTAGIAALFLAGFVFTSLLLIQQGQQNFTAVLASFLVYGLALRWFSIKERKLALKEALEERQARLESSQKEQSSEGGHPGEETPEVRIPPVREEEEMDLSVVGEQTRSLLGFLVGMSLAVHLWSSWTQFDPILDALSRFEAGGGFSIGDVAIVALVLAVTIATMRNLPGLLEVLVLRRLDIDAGTRNAMVTLAKYAVVAAGAIFLFRNLGVDWAQFGWIAAALSVGLGFGLQEVVANFVSGIILLFERPIRVGDVVTVDGIDGVVSRIQIRATTITNWDRKEFVVPNKQFVTGTVLNWTLSSSVNRIVIPVGVAYGSDTEKARELLIEVANDHPRILDDPAPLASFEEFADSCLKLVLRCYLPTLDNRLNTITELHSEIDRRFKGAGIEIAFPQMDLHLRNVPKGFGRGGLEPSKD